MRRIFLLLVISTVTAALSLAQSTVDNLSISIDLQDNGDAVVSETWSIDVGSSISEWYLVIGNLGKMSLDSFSVRDETGNEYANDGEWDTERSRAQKAGRCGTVTKSNGFELCWGVGSSGHHTYTATYTLRGLVQGHSDLDGFNYKFVNAGLSSPPEKIELRVRKRGTSFSPDSNASVWSFGFKGSIGFENGEIVARTSGPFTRKSSMIVMCGFSRGTFTPSIQDSGKTFEQIRSRALEGSDYGVSDIWASLIAYIIAAAVVLLPARKIVKDRKRRKELLGGSEKTVAWFRDVPVKGSLRKAYSIISVIGPSGSDKENIIAAYITRLLYRKALTITRDTDGSARLMVMPFPSVDLPQFGPSMNLSDEETAALSAVEKDIHSEKVLHGFLERAAGEDSVIQEKELRKWLRKNEETVHTWLTSLQDKKITLKTLTAKDVREVYGLKRFLKDFTLIKDRGAVEIGLWNNYIIFASLFGIADQLRKDFRQVCPEYYEMSKVASTLEDPLAGSVLPDVYRLSRSINAASSHYVSRTTARTSGRGGSASFGGGGGFSGGGFGGGGR